MFLPIVLCDLDAAFLGFELLRHPQLAAAPVIVGGAAAQRGVVATASYEARAFGIRSGMATAEALRRCPHATFLPVDMRYYQEMSHRFRDVVTRGVAVWEPVALDEVYLDLNGQRESFPDTAAFACALQRSVQDELGLHCSVGASGGRALAKLACELLAKPGGVALLPPQEAHGVLGSRPVGVLPGIGPATEATLTRYGISTCGRLAALSDDLVVALLGQRGPVLRDLARGVDPSRPQVPGGPRSISVEETFATDLRGPDAPRSALVSLAWELGLRLGAEGLAPREVGLVWRTADFRDHSRQRTLAQPVRTRMELRLAALGLWQQADVRQPVRLLGIRAGHLVHRPRPLLPEDRLEAVLGDLEAQGRGLRPAALLRRDPR